MKKLTLFLTVAALLLLASCNVDSEHGIYYQVATSQPSSGYNIVKFLGQEADTYYFLADNGICYTTETKGDTQYVAGSKDQKIQHAFKSGDSFYYLNASGNLFKLENGTSTAVYEGEKFRGLEANGYLYDNITISKLPSDTEHGISLTVAPLVSKDAILVMDSSTEANVYIGGVSNPITISGFTANAKGFHVANGASTLFVFNEKNLYEVAAGSSSTLSEPIVSSLDTAPTSGYKAVHYADGSDAYLLVRTAKGFTKINTTSHEVTEKNVQFLSTLNDVVVIDMVTFGIGKVAIITYSNGIYIADMVNETLSSDIL